MESLFFCFNHQGKADAYIQALTARGWTLTRQPGRARFILSDVDVYGREKALAEYHKLRIPIFLYPHAARPNIFWDFPGAPYSGFATAHFVSAEGHIDIMRAYGNKLPLHAVGWHLSPIVPFRPRMQVKRILFAPIHPNSNGFLGRLDKELNLQTLKKLLPLMEGDVSVKVRYLHDLKQNGLWRAGGVEYMEGQADLSYRQVDEADLVVGHQTIAYISVARGVPTVMMGEWHTPRLGGTEEKLVTVRSWDKYKDLMMYPLDILAEDDTMALFNRAIESDCEIAEWRERLIGKPFAADHFVDVVESYL